MNLNQFIQTGCKKTLSTYVPNKIKALLNTILLSFKDAAMTTKTIKNMTFLL